MNRRSVLNASVLGLVAVIGGTSAFAAWSSAASGKGASSALVVPKVTGVSAPNGSGSSTITWDAATFAPGVTGYLVQRYTNSTGTTGQATVCANASTTSCTDTTVGTFWYGVTALYKPTGVSWAGPQSDRAQATITAVATSPAGIALSNITTAPSPALDCTGGTVAARTCSSTGEATNAGNVLTANIQLVNSSGAAFTNTSGSAITIDLSIPTGPHATGGDGTLSTASLTVNNNSSSSSGQFTLTRSSGSQKSAVVTATIHGTSKTLTITMSS